MRLNLAVLPLFAVLTVPSLGLAQGFDSGNGFVQFVQAPQSFEATIDEAKIKAADAAYQKGDFARVEQIANELLTTAPNSVLAKHLRASARVELGRMSRSKAQVRTGIEDARQALALEGNNYAFLYIPYVFGMTTLSELENRPVHAQLALTAIQPVLLRSTIKPDEKLQLHFQCGLANMALGNTKQAIGDFRQTLAMNPRHTSANIKLAQAQIAARDVKAALATLDKAIEMLPTTPLVFNERGMLRRNEGNLDGAVEDFSAAVKLDPKFAVALINRGVTLMDQNSPEAALNDFEAALKVQPQNLMIKHLRGAAKAVVGDFDAAIADYTAAWSGKQSDPSPIQERGFARFFKGDFAGAAADFEWCLGQQPTATFLIPWQATALMRAGQPEAGQKLLAKLLERPSEEIGWLGTVAAYLAGKIDQDTLLKAAVDAGGNPFPARECEAWFYVGQKKLLSDDAVGAKEAFQKAVATDRHAMAAHRASRFEVAKQ